MTVNDTIDSSSDAFPEDATARRKPRLLHAWIGGVAVVVVFAVIVPARLWKPDTFFTIRQNVQIAEAQAWRSGRLDLPERKHDTAVKDGKVYSYFPPMFTVIATGIVAAFDQGVPHLAVVVLLVAPAVLLVYILFLHRTRSAWWGAVLAIGFLCGTSAFPVLNLTMIYARPYDVNHTLAVIGLCLILLDYFGRRRLWPAAIGLTLAGLSRQLTGVFALALLFMCLDGVVGARRWGRLAFVGVTCVALGCLYGGLNTAKFGHPLRTGYMLNHEGRDDVFAREAREHGLLSLHWVPRNLYYANIGLPQLHRIDNAGRQEWYVRPNTMGTGIWWTSPLLLWVLVDLKRLVRDRSAAVLLAASAVLFGMLMFWHATGAEQRGFNRYSLDYAPVLLALIAPRCITPGRRVLTLAMIAWGIVYFVFVLPMPHIRIW
ncbi:MAG: hypothetical protein PVI86_01330 [Phycisphaerae bacterium]|jgi:hypothetical protein